MKICPYCKHAIKDNWYYCRNCNKPLIVNLKDGLEKTLRFPYDESESFHLDLEEEGQLYENIIIEDEEIDQKIKKIDEILKDKEILGEPIPGSLLLEKSSLYYKKRDLLSSAKYLELALKNYKADNDLLHIAICHNELGLIQEEDGFFETAIYHFNDSLEILKDLNDPQKIIKTLNNLGNAYYLIKDLENAYKFYQEALQLSKQENFRVEEIKSASNLVEVLYLLKDYDRIKRILARNAEFFKENEDVYGIILTDIKNGKLYFIMSEDYDLAYQHLTNALDLIKNIRNTVSIFIRAKLEWECFLYLGKLHLIRKNIIDAENSLLQSLEAVRIFGVRDNINEGEILEELAKLYSTKRDDKRAVEYYNLAYEIYYKFGDNIKCADLKYKIAQLYSDSEKNKSLAVSYFQEALDLYEDLGYMKEAAILLHKLGDFYLHKGMIEMAITNLERSRDYYKDFQDDYHANFLEEKIKSITND